MTASADSNSETLADFLRRLWQARIFVFIGGLTGAVLGGLLLFFLQPHYEARMIVAPSFIQDTGESLMSFETGQPALHPQGFQNALPADFVRFEQVLRQNTVASILSRYEGLLDKVSEDRVFGFQPHSPIKADMLSKYLLKNVRIEPLGSTSSRVISYSHPDPAFAVRLLKHLHTIADETIRQKTGAETQERISWLQKQLNQTANPDHRAALTSLLLAQERRRMLVAMDQPFAAELVEPAAASSRPDWPSSPLVMLVAVFMGMLSGFTIFSLRRTF
jgi:uncharacterized protein involved in exopolysaccharide biosynthesis